MKRKLKRLNERKGVHLTEFKFTDDDHFVRSHFIDTICKLNLEGGRVVVKKTAVKPHLKDNKSVLYNYLVAEPIMSAIIANYDHVSHINLHLDLSMDRSSRENFDDYIRRKISWKQFVMDSEAVITNKVYHEYSHHEPCLQVADYISGATFQHYERKNPQYYEILRQKIRHSHGWGV